MLAIPSLVHSVPTQDQQLLHALLVQPAPIAPTTTTDLGLSSLAFALQVCTHKQARTCVLNVQLVANASTPLLHP